MEAWSRVEVEAIVADHIALLVSELRGDPYSKTEHRRRLEGRLNHRSKGSIERKHQNISAILLELGLPYIDGYKPLGHYQELLGDVVRERVQANAELLQAVAIDVERVAIFPEPESILTCLVDAPAPPSWPEVTHERPVPMRLGVNYLAREAANRSLGSAGERFVVQFERARLIDLGQERLADRVEHVSLTHGDGAGFDVLSFDPGGAERFIEVKTTAYGALTPFFLTRNELAVSRERPMRFHLYRLFGFRKPVPRFFQKSGALDEAFRLEPVQFQARMA